MQVKERTVEVSGPRGKLQREITVPDIAVRVEDGKVIVERTSETEKSKAAHGLMRVLIANMVRGVSEGFRETLVLVGVGYRAQLQGNALMLSLGYSHPVRVEPPAGITVEVEGSNRIHLLSADKEKLGAFVAHLKGLRPMSRYGYKDGRGKGIRKEREHPRFVQRRQTAG